MFDQTITSLLQATGLFDPVFYRGHPGVPPDLQDDALLAHFIEHGVAAGAAPSPLFDAATLVEAAGAAGLPKPAPGLPPLIYWLRQAIVSQIVPTRLFDADFYRRTYPDVESAGYFGFLHFLLFGMAEGRRPNLWFDPDWFEAQCPPPATTVPSAKRPSLLRFLTDDTASHVSPSRALRLLAWPLHDRAATARLCIQVDATLVRLAQDFTDPEVLRLASMFVPEHYAAAAALPAGASDAEAFRHFAETGLAAGLSCNPLFDADFYRDQIAPAALRPPRPGEPLLAHWVREGEAAGIVPTPVFDAAFYLLTYPEIAAAGVPAFAHFLDHGLFEDRRPNAWFDADYVAIRHPRPARPGFLAYLLRSDPTEPPCNLIGSVLQHLGGADIATFDRLQAALLRHFDPLRRNLAPWTTDTLFALFDAAFYAAHASLPAETSPPEAFAHYLEHGLRSGCDPSSLFDTDLYRKQVAARPNLPAIGEEGPVAHFLRVGLPERIVPTHRFDEPFYLAEYPDLDVEHVFGYAHFLCHGMAEGRRPNPWFDPAFCQSQLQDAQGRPATRPAHYRTFLLRGLDAGVVPGTRLASLLGSTLAQGEISPARFDALLQASQPWLPRIGLHGLDLALALFIPEAYDGAGEIDDTTGILDRLIHFLAIGLVRGDPIGPLFDPDHYLIKATHAGLPPPAGMAPLLHFLLHGFAARIVPAPLFDAQAYLEFNPDLLGTPLWAFEHFLRHGIAENRVFSRLPSVRVATSPGPAAARAARLRLLVFSGQLPRRTDATEGARLSALLASQTRLRETIASDQLAEIIAQAQRLEPGIGDLGDLAMFMVAPFFNPIAERHGALRARLPRQHYDTVVCVPWIRNGGADLVAGLFTQALGRIRPGERVLLVRVDQPYFERADWLPPEIDVIDISDILRDVGDTFAEQLLYTLFIGLAPKRIVNINSHLAWCCLRRYGERLAASMRLYAYLFCWDQTPSGRRIGYPSDFYPTTAAFLSGVFTDTQYLKDELVQMYRLPRRLADRLMPLRSPARTMPAIPSMAERGAADAAQRLRPLVLWGGRLDFQKRFDILVAVARLLPEIDFRCWGSAMLDAPPDLSDLPANIRMHGSFKALTDLPLGACDGWLFTSAWEGMPTTVIELAIQGMPMVCSSVGGVPDLIDATTGWLIDPQSPPEAYADAVREMVDRPDLRIARGRAVQKRALAMFSPSGYDSALAQYLDLAQNDRAA